MILLKTNFGDIKIELDHEKAPITVQNFLEYVKSGFYNNTIFHRIIDGFMIQGGGFASEMKNKKNRSPIKNEANKKEALRNERGTIAMARTNDPHSATSQFFINVSNNHFLDHSAENSSGWGYCAFGRVIDGLEIIDRIKSVSTTEKHGHQDVPVDDVVLEEALILED